ncbi:MAG: SUMF1/EgtB/PvdO family nonheme iron enzyme [Treponema sp.]|nr:SUMF1/EgtB/PvdO family nonheme iron enzyme [Treponema sp.]
MKDKQSLFQTPAGADRWFDSQAPRFISALLLFSLVIFLFPACPQPGGENTETGPEAPAAPATPELRPGNRRLVLNWPAVPGADSYEVFCGETGAEDTPAQTVNVPAADIPGLENGTSYYVRLRAKNSAGPSGFSPAVMGTPSVRLPAPSLVRGDNELSVGWAAEEGVEYEIWYRNGGSGSAVKWDGGISRSGISAGTTISGLANGLSCSVWIKIAGDETAAGVETTGTPEAPPVSPGGDFVYVPAGTITGSGDYAFSVTVPTDPPGYTGAGAATVRKGVFVEGRTVAIPSFVMAKYETTQELWFTVQDWALEKGYQFQNKKNNAPTEDNKNKPVSGVSWRDAIVWCNAYSEMVEGLEPVYYYPADSGNVLKDSRNAAACDGAVMDKNKSGFRLPTEAEREFAARGGNPGLADWMYKYAGSNNADEVAWHHGNSAYQTKVVGSAKKANRLGIFDLSGNVQEWCWDWMNYAADITASTPPDGAAYSGGAPLVNQKAFNGGGVGSNITYSCVTHRWGYAPDYKDSYVGFRVVRTP